MSTTYALQIGGARNLVWHPGVFHSKVPSLYVKVTLAGIVYRTPTIKNNLTPVWDHRLSLEPSPPGTSLTLNIQVKHNTRLGHNTCIAYADIGLNNLLEKCKDGEVEINLQMPPGARGPASAGLLRLCLETSTAIDDAKNDVTSARQAVEQSEIPGLSITGIVNGVADDATDNSDMYKALGQLCEKLDKIVQVMDVVSAVHPYLSVAWRLSSSVYKAVSKQVKADQDLIELVQLMGDAFNFVNEAETLREKCHSLEKAIIGLLKQTSECCRFIQQYTRHSFIRRTVDSSNTGKITEFKRVLSVLQGNVNSGINLSAALTTARVLEKVNALFLDGRLKSSTTRSFNRPQCLAGTRVELLNRLVEWAQSTSDQNVFWLNGVAGCGKSTVSTTIAEGMREVGRLATFIAFERGKSDPDTVIQMIAHGLASFHSSFAESVISAIQEDSNIVNASANAQFDKLLLNPLQAASAKMNGPVIIVLDALDECGTSSTRKPLLQLVGDEFSRLPKNFRFLITSRPETDITNVLSYHPEFVAADALDYLSKSSEKDVLAYIHVDMKRIIVESRVELPESWQWDSKMESLGKAAGGLFIWASTAVKYVSESEDDRVWRLQRLVGGSQSLDLDELYTTVLESRISWNDPHSKSRFHSVIGLLLFSKIPLSSSAIDGILGYPLEHSSHSLLLGLRSVIDFAPDGSVRLFHTSFADYLTASKHADKQWFIDELMLRMFISERCFLTMQRRLRFNICELESSHIRNEVVPGLQQRISDRIPTDLEYACIFWARHLLEAQFSSDRLPMLKDFVQSRLLYWLEVLSLLKKLDGAAAALLDAARWSAKHDAEISAFLRDARNLVSLFYEPMSESTPHVYLSALPLSPPNSRVAAHYIQRMCFLPQVKRTGLDQQALLRVIAGHTGQVLSVALSSDGTRIASGSDDRTIRVWDVESGQPLGEPLKGHTDWVRSVALSSDGSRVVSGSDDSTIRVWDVASRQVVSGPFEGHAGTVYSVAFSSDGTRIASGSADQTIRVWDAERRQQVGEPFQGHAGTIYSVAFSSDGALIVSGSADHTMRVWDVGKGQQVGEPFRGHAGGVESVALSSDGTRVVSGSSDSTIRVWDVKSRKPIGEPYKGHTDWVRSVALSSDGSRVASGSDDNTIRVWDVASGQAVSGPFEGHAGTVYSVAFSSDGTRIVSGSADQTIRVWDDERRLQVGEPFRGHTDDVYSIALSPDGMRIISGSADKTIRVWDVRSGQPIGEPFKGHVDWVRSVVLSSDGTRFVSGSDDWTIRVWNVESGQIIAGPFEGHTGMVNSVALSSDGTRIVSGSSDKTIRVWDASSGQAIGGPFEGHAGTVFSVALSSDGTRIISGSADKTIRVWDLESWQPIGEPFKGHTDWIRSVALSSDGSRVVSGSDDRTIRVWDVTSGQVVAGPFEGHTDWVRSVAFSSDGVRIVSGSDDKTIRVWDVMSGQPVASPLEGHTDLVSSVVLSPDGAHIVSGSGDKTIRMWRMPDDSRFCASFREGQSISNWKLDESGWIKHEDDLLLWIPPSLRHGLYRAENTAIMSCPSTTRIDFSGFAHGEDWHKCFKPF